MTPGSNLLSMTRALIAQQTVQYESFLSGTVNPAGFEEDTYSPAVSIMGSLQPIPRKTVELMGLDRNKNYVTFYSSTAIADIEIGRASDRITFDGKLFVAVDNDDWHAVDGWNAPVFVEQKT